jgi:hypothetical protein
MTWRGLSQRWLQRLDIWPAPAAERRGVIFFILNMECKLFLAQQLPFPETATQFIPTIIQEKFISDKF